MAAWAGCMIGQQTSARAATVCHGGHVLHPPQSLLPSPPLCCNAGHQHSLAVTSRSTPLLQFVDGGRKALEATDAGSDQPVAQLPRDQGSARSLRTFLESFITQEFLPEVYVTFR